MQFWIGMGVEKNTQTSTTCSEKLGWRLERCVCRENHPSRKLCIVRLERGIRRRTKWTKCTLYEKDNPSNPGSGIQPTEEARTKDPGEAGASWFLSCRDTASPPQTDQHRHLNESKQSIHHALQLHHHNHNHNHNHIHNHTTTITITQPTPLTTMARFAMTPCLLAAVLVAFLAGRETTAFTVGTGSPHHVQQQQQQQQQLTRPTTALSSSRRGFLSDALSIPAAVAAASIVASSSPALADDGAIVELSMPSDDEVKEQEVSELDEYSVCTMHLPIKPWVRRQ